MIELQDITDGTLRKRWSLKEFEEFHRGVKPPKAKSLYDYPFGKVFLEELVPIMVWLTTVSGKARLQCSNSWRRARRGRVHTALPLRPCSRA